MKPLYVWGLHDQAGLHMPDVTETAAEVYIGCKKVGCGWLKTRSVGRGETPAEVRQILEQDFLNHAGLRQRVREQRYKIRKGI